MAQKFVIDIFKPAEYSKCELDLHYLAEILEKNFQFASMGRYAFYHILNALNIHQKILIPAYICNSILDPLKILKIEPVFYDLDMKDLNASLESIAFLAQKFEVKSILIASMYGNPANLVEIEKFCHDNGIILIDDSAQSFGAKFDNRYVGTFGDAGFFSLSPGKPAAAHMGAFFWTGNENYHIQRTKHLLYHHVCYWDFFFNRLNRYRYNKIKLNKLFPLLKRMIGKMVDITNDDISPFETPIIGGIINAVLNNQYSYRKKYVEDFSNRFGNNPYFRIIQSIRGEANNHKLVLLANDLKVAQNLSGYLYNNGIYNLNGYAILTDDYKYLSNCQKINKRVIEIPIENNQLKMDYLFQKIESFKG